MMARQGLSFRGTINNTTWADWEVTTEGWKTAGKGREATLPDAKYAAVEALNTWYSS